MRNYFLNMKLSLKLLLTSLIPILLISGLIGGLGYFNIKQLSGIIQEIVNQRVPSLINLSVLERTAYQMILDEKTTIMATNDSRLDTAKYHQATLKDIDLMISTLDQLDAIAGNFNDQDLLAKSNEVRQVTNQFKELFAVAVNKTAEQKELVTTMVAKGTQVTVLTNSYYKIVTSKNDENSVLAMPILVDILNTVSRTRINQNKYMLNRDVTNWNSVESDIKDLFQLFTDLKKVTTDLNDQMSLDQAKSTTEDYYTAAKSWHSVDDELQSIVNQMEVIGARVQENAISAESAGLSATEASRSKANEIVWQSTVVNLAAIVIAILIGLLLGIYIPKSIVRPLNQIEKTARRIAEGDIDQQIDIRTKDEIGSLAQSFQTMIIYMQDMAATAIAISNGDLSIKVQPKSEQDILGNSFQLMVKSLKNALVLVAACAEDLEASSGQLAASAAEAALATNQITTTVQQVASGTLQQAESSSKTANLIEEMGRSISSVEVGAKEQGRASANASDITVQLSDAIQQVAGNAQAVTQESNQAAEAARQGTKTVETTIEGMKKIQEKVGASAQKVHEMGNRSDQIGAIVETIDDIASQTNLLALNAAIEAARAGEHGKGFAVVADEVRKLAERSSIATKEIGSLIKEIQRTVGEAVKAMSEGAAEVQNGVIQANESGKALANILTASEAVYSQASLATQATIRMNSFSEELIKSVDKVSRIAETNSSSADQMKISSDEVTLAIENIASISEENSASIEEVSASAEEMSAQVEEVTASAQGLAETSQQLIMMLSRFKLAA
jgi:methyl-accepting chemotaxis protein